MYYSLKNCKVTLRMKYLRCNLKQGMIMLSSINDHLV